MASNPTNENDGVASAVIPVSISVTPKPAKHTTSPSLSKGPVYRSANGGSK